MHCEICGFECESAKGFGLHIVKIHKISTETYYKQFLLKSETDGLCKTCGKQTKFRNLAFGYSSFCCSRCGTVNPETIEKLKATNLRIYGQAHHNELSKEEREARLIEKQRLTPQQRREETCLKKYGVKSPLCLKTVQEQSKLTQIEKHGHVCNFASKEYTENWKQKYKEKTGYDSPNQNPAVKQKKIETFNSRFGVDNPMQNHDILVKQHKRYEYNGVNFDSSWELAYFIYLTDHNISFEYHPNISFKYTTDDGIIHQYFPDFKVEDTLVEIKGEHLLTGNMKIPDSKIKCMQDNSVQLIDASGIKPIMQYIKNKYGKTYLSKFRHK